MKKIIPLLIVVIAIVSFSSCYYDKADLLYPGSTICDTTAAVSYSGKIVPLFNSQCYGCHRSGAGNVTMGTYATDKVIATNGKLIGCISYASGFSPMPKGATKLSNCNIALINKWVSLGTPNN